MYIERKKKRKEERKKERKKERGMRATKCNGNSHMVCENGLTRLNGLTMGVKAFQIFGVGVGATLLVYEILILIFKWRKYI